MFNNEEIRKISEDYKKKLFSIVNYKKYLLKTNGKLNVNKQFTLIYDVKPVLDENKYKNVLSSLLMDLCKYVKKSS